MKWISVEDRLPEKGRHVITYLVPSWTDDLDYAKQKIQFIEDSGMWSSMYDENYVISHWQPLPEPPKELK